MNELVVRSDPNLPALTGGNAGVFLPSAAQKAAIVLSVLDAQEAADLLKEFDESTIANFAEAVVGMRPITPMVMENVIIEFLGELGEGGGVRGGASQARRLLSGVLSDKEVDRIIDRLENPEKGAVWERLNAATTDEVFHYLQTEHPQTVMVILSKMRADKAAAILERLERDFAQGVVMRLSTTPTIAPEVMDHVEQIMTEDFLSALSDTSSAVTPAEVIGNLMNNVSSSVRDQFLEHMQSSDAELAAEVIKVMFTFADIETRVASNEVAKFVKDVEEERLIIALRYAKDTENPSYDFIMANLSKRLGERLAEEVDGIDAVKEKDGEAAQMETVNVIQRKAKAGDITLLEIDPDD